MAVTSDQKIDFFTHIIPTQYKKALFDVLPSNSPYKDLIEATPTLYDFEHRFRILDKFEKLMQVVTISSPPIELFTNPNIALELAKLANDEMAELVVKYPERFVAAVATLPMNDIDAALKELERAINDLNLRGVQIYTSVCDEPIDLPKYMPFYEKMNQYNLPIWLHPYRPLSRSDYLTENYSKYRIFHIFGWPYETSAAMARLVFSGVLERYPNLKFVTHHCGGMIPYFEARILQQKGYLGVREACKELPKPPLDYFKMFYADTAVSGSTSALICGKSFFSVDHMVFGTDMPYGPDNGDYVIRHTIDSINRMELIYTDKTKIFQGNAIRLLRL